MGRGECVEGCGGGGYRGKEVISLLESVSVHERERERGERENERECVLKHAQTLV